MDLVKMAVEADDSPIGVLLMMPPEIVRSFATLESARVPNQTGVNVCISPEEVIVRRMLSSGDDVAKVCEAPV